MHDVVCMTPSLCSLLPRLYEFPIDGNEYCASNHRFDLSVTPGLPNHLQGFGRYEGAISTKITSQLPFPFLPIQSVSHMPLPILHQFTVVYMICFLPICFGVNHNRK